MRVRGAAITVLTLEDDWAPRKTSGSVAKLVTRWSERELDTRINRC